MALLNHNAVLTTALFYKNFILNISRSTKPAPLFWDLFGITGQFRPFPASWCVLPHPLQNRVPRVQVLLPLPQNRRKHWVFAGFLFARVAWSSGAFWFGHLVFSSGFTRPHLLHSSPAPGTHPVSPFSGFSGCVSLFLPSFDLQNFPYLFCSLCHLALKD